MAVICFEWLQRPENVVAGLLTWPDYRSKKWPHAVRIEHHKNSIRRIFLRTIHSKKLKNVVLFTHAAPSLPFAALSSRRSLFFDSKQIPG